MADERRYLAYLVRLWTVHHNGDLVWRASAENAHTGERRAFADLAGLFEFLRGGGGARADRVGQLEGGRGQDRGGLKRISGRRRTISKGDADVVQSVLSLG